MALAAWTGGDIVTAESLHHHRLKQKYSFQSGEKKKQYGVWNSFVTYLVLEVYFACFSLHASSPKGHYSPGFSAGKVARFSQASPHVTGCLGIFLMGWIFFQTIYDVSVLRENILLF